MGHRTVAEAAETHDDANFAALTSSRVARRHGADETWWPRILSGRERCKPLSGEPLGWVIKGACVPRGSLLPPAARW
jgi:hypothetical protein